MSFQKVSWIITKIDFLKAILVPINRKWYIYMMEYYSAIKKNEIFPFATAWMELEGIMLSEINQSEKDIYHMISLICGI